MVSREDDNGVLENRGHIDGKRTEVRASTINNLGPALLAGDQLLIGATTLNNLSGNYAGAVINPMIAARDVLTIGIKDAVNNRNGAMIYSAGPAVLTAAGEVVINNESATIEITGDAKLDVKDIYNRNLNFKTRDVEISREEIVQYQARGSSERLDSSQIKSLIIGAVQTD